MNLQRTIYYCSQECRNVLVDIKQLPYFLTFIINYRNLFKPFLCTICNFILFVREKN